MCRYDETRYDSFLCFDQFDRTRCDSFSRFDRFGRSPLQFEIGVQTIHLSVCVDLFLASADFWTSLFGFLSASLALVVIGPLCLRQGRRCPRSSPLVTAAVSTIGFLPGHTPQCSSRIQRCTLDLLPWRVVLFKGTELPRAVCLGAAGTLTPGQCLLVC